MIACMYSKSIDPSRGPIVFDIRQDGYRCKIRTAKVHAEILQSVELYF